MPAVEAKRAAFRALHETGCFVIPNPYDMGTARWLQREGFKALATTSSGAAWSYGYPDGGLGRDVMIEHIAEIAAASDLPVNADFLNGFADEPEDLLPNVALGIGTGIAGLSIEDMDADRRLYDTDLAVERVRAARKAIDEDGGGVFLVARCESFLLGMDDALRIAVDRLERLAEAGADCLYAPDVTRAEDIATIVRAVAPKPVNVLARNLGGLTLADLAGLGVRRVSVGGGFARVAWSGVMAAGKALAEGRLDVFDGTVSGSALNALFAEDEGDRG
ncbi:MAG: isocitrate lyase/phosphoenolpyruvate mutase family protein [Rhizobiales bacterium]|nr:isocitrate lyase/phosphoenolpyruvate mutase family protein [Hyphomicrobiales bacterium]